MSFVIINDALVGYNGSEGFSEVVVPDGVTEIAQRAFMNCRELVSITLPDSVKKICTEAFAGCTALESFRFPEDTCEIGLAVFEGCTSLRSVRMPTEFWMMGETVFKGCTALEEIIVPHGYSSTFITAEMLQDTKWYRENNDEFVILGGELLKYNGHDSCPVIPRCVQVICEGAFEDCDIESVELHEKVDMIGHRAFKGCTRLRSIDLPEKLFSIGCFAFENCVSLKTITIPAGVNYVCSGAFRGCEGLECLVVESSQTEFFDGFDDRSSLKLVIAPNGISSKNDSVF